MTPQPCVPGKRTPRNYWKKIVGAGLKSQQISENCVSSHTKIPAWGKEMWYLWPLHTPRAAEVMAHLWRFAIPYLQVRKDDFFLALIFTLVSSTKLAYFNIWQSVWTLSEVPRAIIRRKRWGLVLERDQQSYQKHKTQTHSLFPV